MAAQKLKRLPHVDQDPCRLLDGRVECPYCFADLCNQAVVFLDNKRNSSCQSCSHFLHAKCCSAIAKRARQESTNDIETQPTCPKCQSPFEESEVVPVPHPFEDTDGWYAALDVLESNRLPRERMLEALLASLPVDAATLRAAIWKKGQLRGKLSLSECKEVLAQLQMELPKIQRHQSPVLPDIENAEEWFAHWDVSGAGMLTQEETTRALLKSFPKHDLTVLRAAIDVAWQEYSKLNPNVADMSLIGTEAFSDRDSGIVGLALQKYMAAKYWKLWGTDDCNVAHLPRCLSCLSDDAL